MLDKDLDLFLKQNLENPWLNNFIYDDPTVFGFKLTFYDNNKSPLFSNLNDSVLSYIINNFGEFSQQKSDYDNFKKSLFDLNEKYSYFIQKINGLDDLYDFKPDLSYIERTIDIETLESLDLRVSKIIEYYNRLVYDQEYRRYNIPVNLRHFTFTISVFEIRRFGTFVSKIKTSNAPNDLILLNNHLGMYNFTFEKSLFDFSSSNPFLSELNNSQPTPAMNKIKIKCGRMKNDSYLPMQIKLEDVDDVNLSGDSIFNELKEKNLINLNSAFSELTIKKMLDRTTNIITRNNIYFDDSTNMLKNFKLNDLNESQIRDLENLAKTAYSGALGLENINPLSGGFSIYEKIIISIILTKRNLQKENKFSNNMNKIIPGFSQNPVGSIFNAAQKSSISAILGI
jgi:hypothetical protein